jgi:hypothetical protein
MTRSITPFVCLAALGVGAIVHAETPARIITHAPERPDPKAQYLFYLHGRIVEDQGADAVSPEFGRYEYRAILRELARSGHVVISDVRARDTDPKDYAALTAAEVRRLLAAGVPSGHVTVIGASKGSVIAMLVSTQVIEPVRYVVLANCNDYTLSTFSLNLHGDVLSIYEASDPTGQTCRPLFERSAKLGERKEIRLETGLKHGFLFKPLEVWIGPALAWASGNS